MDKLVIGAIVFSVILFSGVIYVYRVHTSANIQRKRPKDTPTASCAMSPSKKSTCGALDPVNDPAYNVKETIKNTILIEQHLAEKRKYCKECLVKHFLLSIGLLEEAIWMAAQQPGNYPKLENSASFYQTLFDKWRANMDLDSTRIEVLQALRTWRQEMIRLYFF